MFTPTRLLDIYPAGEDAIDAPVRVVNTKAAALSGVKYATLSHCWGKKAFINLTPENEPLLTTRGIPWHELPKNFQQAIIVTRRALSVRYIWIDSLCIIQGPHGDFHSEAGLMHAVYRNSHCNLAAADSSDSSGGLFRLRDPASILPPTYEPRDTGPSQPRSLFAPRGTPYRIVPASLWHDALLSTPIYARGWVFQERLLSPRLLHFTASQIFWDCAGASASEAFPAGLPAPLDAAAASSSATDRHWRARLQDGALLRPLAGRADDSVDAFWRAAVRSYTACALTNGADKLVAVWGIAKLVRDALGEVYAAGLWAERLEEQLAWRVEGEGAGWRPRPLRAPSWSWASLDGAVRVGDRFPGDRRCYVVGDHGGGAIAFEAVERAGRPELGGRKGSSSWSEQFKVWDEQQREVGKMRSSWKIKRQESGESTTTVTSNSSQVTDRGDQPPVLKSQSIAIQGWVGRMRIGARESSRRWMVENVGLDPDDASLEVFPDERLPSSVHDCCFVILALSRDGAGLDEEDKDEDEDEENDELNELEEDEDEGDSSHGGQNQDGMGEDHSAHLSEEVAPSEGSIGFNAKPKAQEQTPAMFSGVGIIIQPTEEKTHFYRTGSLHLKGIRLKTLRVMEKGYFQESCQALDEPHEEKGHKFWLD